MTKQTDMAANELLYFLLAASSCNQRRACWIKASKFRIAWSHRCKTELTVWRITDVSLFNSSQNIVTYHMEGESLQLIPRLHSTVRYTPLAVGLSVSFIASVPMELVWTIPRLVFDACMSQGLGIIRQGWAM